MKRTAFALTGLTILCCAFPLWAEEPIAGVVEINTGGQLYVNSLDRVFVLELLEHCEWCRPGAEVSIRFVGPARAVVEPVRTGPGSNVSPSVRVIVLRDGRLGN